MRLVKGNKMIVIRIKKLTKEEIDKIRIEAYEDFAI